MKPVLLWTDVCFFLVLLGVLCYLVRVWRNDLLRSTWAHVFEDGPAVASFVVLMAALFITILDSLHFQVRISAPDTPKAVYAPQVKSFLDLVLGDIANGNEKSYSAPLSLYALSKENIERKGQLVREHPPLKYAGQQLSNPENHGLDMARRILAGGVLGALAGAVVYLFWVLSLQSLGRQASAAIRTWGLGALLVLGIVVGAALQLSEDYHVLGTDKVGLDVFYSALKSLRTAVVLGLITTLVSLPLGVFAGLAAGYFRGWVDDVIQYIYTTLNSIPGVLLIAAAVLMLQIALDSHANVFATSAEKSDLRLFFLCVILGITSWTGLARLLRGEALKLRELDYVLAARAFGATHGQILRRHLLPNVMHIVLIMLVMDFSSLVLAEAVLSYVGVGVDPSTHSFGTMINAARLELSREPVVWWTLAAAFVFMLVLVLAANLFADAVRDAFDPRARQLKKSLVRV